MYDDRQLALKEPAIVLKKLENNFSPYCYIVWIREVLIFSKILMYLKMFATETPLYELT